MTGKEALDDYKDFGKIKGESITSNQTFASKEALRILSECANGEKKLLFSDSLDLEQIISKRLEKLEKLEKVVEILKKQLVFRYRKDDVLEIHKDIWRKNHPKIVLVTSWDEDVILKEVLGNENT